MQDALISTWRLISASMQDESTGETHELWGQQPNGILVVTPERRWIVIQTAEQRKPPHDDPGRVEAFKSMIAYSGKFHIDGDTITINVDIAWDENWVGTEQVRKWRIEGNRLHIEALPQPYDIFGGRVMRGLLVWEKAE